MYFLRNVVLRNPTKIENRVDHWFDDLFCLETKRIKECNICNVFEVNQPCVVFPIVISLHKKGTANLTDLLNGHFKSKEKLEDFSW